MKIKKVNIELSSIRQNELKILKELRRELREIKKERKEYENKNIFQ